MADKISWRSFDFLAVALNKKYPETDLLFLTNDDLKRMLGSLAETKDFPSFPSEKDEADDVCRSVKVAWARVAAGASPLDMMNGVAEEE